MNYCVYMATSGKLIQCTLALVLLTMVEVLSGGVSTLGTQMRSGGRKDVPTLNTRDTSLSYITMHFALLVGYMSSLAAVIFEGQVNVMMGAFHGPRKIS